MPVAHTNTRAALTLAARLSDFEDALVERKLEGANGSEIRRTAVAFANSVPKGASGVIFLGVSDDGRVVGVNSPDKLQKSVRGSLDQCYPPISYQAHVLEVDDKAVIAIEIPESRTRPHFAGGAFVRVGSESVLASEAKYEELILSRHDVARALLEVPGELWTVEGIGNRLGPVRPRALMQAAPEPHEGRVEEVTGHYARILLLGPGRIITVGLHDLCISYDDRCHRRMIVITANA